MRCRGLARVLLTLLLCAVLGGCYLPSALRRSQRIVAGGFDWSEHGAWVAATGPAMTVVAAGDLLVHAFVPLHYDGYFLLDRREPRHKWFWAYRGPMLPLDQVAVLCKTKDSLHIAGIQGRFDFEPREARHEAWHFPECIEVVPGTYYLTVEYYSRRHYDTNSQLGTFTTESTTPAVVEWDARAGVVYRMDSRLGALSPGPGTQGSGSTIREIPQSKRKLGTSRFALDVGTWYVIVTPIASFSELEQPVLEYRAAWQRYEFERR